ncbi:MAG: hypothetical protein IIZ10_08245 [Solobacterium sp.]|jgi:hypothetical protein|nr:hypothetical protein [Solobacterium sp.]
MLFTVRMYLVSLSGSSQTAAKKQISAATVFEAEKYMPAAARPIVRSIRIFENFFITLIL